MKRIDATTRFILIIAGLCLGYGYVCRIAGIDFFWESQTIGWISLLVGLLTLLSRRISLEKQLGKQTLLEKIGVGFIGFVLFMLILGMGILYKSDAYQAAKQYLTGNEQLQSEIGSVDSFSLIPMGGIQVINDSTGEYGAATINLTAKGSRQYKDITVFVEKQPQAPWKVVGIE